MDVAEGKDKIEAYLTILCRAEDISPADLAFKWSLPKESPKNKGGPQGKVHSIKIRLGKESQTLPFPECEVVESISQPELFLLKHKDAILTVLRKLKR